MDQQDADARREADNAELKRRKDQKVSHLETQSILQVY